MFQRIRHQRPLFQRMMGTTQHQQSSLFRRSLKKLTQLGSALITQMLGIVSGSLWRNGRHCDAMATEAVPATVMLGSSVHGSNTNPGTTAALSNTGPPSQDDRTFPSDGSKSEQLEAVLRLARFDGSFVHSLYLQRLTGIEEHVTSAWAEHQWGSPVPMEVLVTACVLAHLMQEFSSDNATWQLVAKKAEEWLWSQQSIWNCANITTVDHLVKAATGFLQS